MNYQLIALDLDGTLLNSRKEIPEEAVRAIRKACAAGKTVVFDTGRAVPELAEQIERLPEVRYAVFASGGGLYDIRASPPPRRNGSWPSRARRTSCPSWCCRTGT